MKLPTSWAEVTIAQYYKLITIFNLYKEDAIERQIKLLALFSGLPDKEIEKMKAPDMIREAMRLDFLGEMPKETKLAHIFKLKGKVYKAALLTSDMQAGQFMDFSHAGKECTAEELPYHMHELIACMCQTRKGNFLFPEWQYEGYSGIAEDFLEMPISQAYPYYVFFCEVLKNSQKPILEYSLKQARKNLKMAERMKPVLS